MYKKLSFLLLICLQVANVWADALIRSDVELIVTNDSLYPWTDGDTYIQSGNVGVKNTTSSYILSFTSACKTEFSFEWLNNDSWEHFAYCYLDGVLAFSTTNSRSSRVRTFIEAGTHVIEFRDSISNSTSTNCYMRISNIILKEIRPLESAVLAEGSQSITFTNSDTYPWTIEDGYIQSSNYGHPYSCSEFHATITVSQTSLLSFERRVGRDNEDGTYSNYYNNDHNFSFIINGNTYVSYSDATSFGQDHVVLEPGNYQLTWRDTIYNQTSKLVSQIRNIKLSQDWITIDLGTDAGSLGVEVLYQVNVLNDVKMLKVKGNINSTDWNAIRQMKNLAAIDLSEAITASVPDDAFNGLSKLSSAILPQTATFIGKRAFRGTMIRTIAIPSSITIIDDEAFYQCSLLETITFTSNSQLNTIGHIAFGDCTNLREFIMPNSVTTLKVASNLSETFCGCEALTKLYLSEGLSVLGRQLCYGCSSLTDIHLPSQLKTIETYAFYKNYALRKIDFPQGLQSIETYAFSNSGLDSIILPSKLSSLGWYAFINCSSLKYIVLPSYVEKYDGTFQDCPSIQEIVCPSITPPAIFNDPFPTVSKSSVTLRVPSVAVASYKLDQYWYRFGNIIEGDDVDYCKISSLLSLANNRRMNGVVDIDLYYGGQLTIGGNSPMLIGEMNYFVDENNPGRLLNNCPAVSVGSLTTLFSVSKNKWYFLTPIYDVELSKITHSADASFVFRYYDGESRATNGTGNSWRNVSDGMLHKGQGYIFQCNADGTIVLPAINTSIPNFFNFENQSIALSAYPAAASANKSWNYVGNPFPAYFDISYIDFTAPITIWDGSTYKAYSIVDDNYVLRPMQAFFVQKPDAIDNLVFRKEGRQHASSVNRAPARLASSSTSRYLFDVQISNSEYQDETRIVLNENSSLAYEFECDASKFMSFNADVPQIYSIDSETTCYSINERPIANGRVSLGYYIGSIGNYTITALRADNDIWLVDKLCNDTINLRIQEYNFQCNEANVTVSNRFELIFSTQKTDVTTSTKQLEQSTIFAHGVKNGIKIRTNQNENITVLSMDGNVMFTEAIKGELFIPMSVGTYIVKANSAVTKVIVY